MRSRRFASTRATLAELLHIGWSSPRHDGECFAREERPAVSVLSLPKRLPRNDGTERELEDRFLELLCSLQPRPGYFALFREIVLDCWKCGAAEASKAAAMIEKRVSELRQRLQRVEDRYLADDIDGRIYRELRDRLRYDITVAELERNEARIEETDVEGVLAFAQHVLENAGALWTNASADDRRALQGALFPTGLAWGRSGIWNRHNLLSLRSVVGSQRRRKRDGVPTGIRTRVSALKGPRPRPLDDGDLRGKAVGRPARRLPNILS